MRLAPGARLLLAVLLATFLAGVALVPGLGLETRAADAFAPPLAASFAFVTFAPAVAAALLLRWPHAAAWLAIAAASFAVPLNLADFAGALTLEPTPPVVRAVELVVVALDLATIVLARRLLAERAVAAAPAA